MSARDDERQGGSGPISWESWRMRRARGEGAGLLLASSKQRCKRFHRWWVTYV